jgi:cytochrome c553
MRLPRPPLALGFALALALALGLAPAPALTAAPPPARVEDSMAQRMQACVVCHGKEGRATAEGYYPRIAGKPSGYLYNQLQHFKAGRRQNVAMAHLLQHLSDAYLREIADHFATLDLPYPPPRAPQLTPAEQQAAEALVFKGAPARGVPACVACHGQVLAGVLPATPGLLALPADYISGQLGAWRTGQRRAAAPDCMADIAQRLTNEEIAVVARWLSAQTLPAGVHAAATPPVSPPLRCGSVGP